MQVYITRQYQFGDEAGETRAYRDPDAAMHWLASAYPERERIVWRHPHPGKWWARIGHPIEGNALYVDEVDVQE
jgi:hypothetical protein